MPPLTDAYDDKLINVFRNTGISAVAAPYIGLFNRSTPPTKAGGGTEVSGGNYTRQALTLGAPAAASPQGRHSTNSGALAFPAGAGVTSTSILSLPADPTQWWALYDAIAGTMAGFGELLGPPILCALSTSAETFTATTHGLSNGQNVQVRVSAGGSYPGGFAVDTEYYVVGAAANTFQLATTVGGSAIDITSVGTGAVTVAKSYIKAIGIGDILSIAAAALDMAVD